MSAKFLSSGAAIFAALFTVAVLAWDQGSVGDDLSDDFMSPSCRIGSPASWTGRPCVVPLRTGSADGTTVSH
jgi:hypothetical protein